MTLADSTEYVVWAGLQALQRKAVDVMLCCDPLGITVFETGGDGAVLEEESIDLVRGRLLVYDST